MKIQIVELRPIQGHETLDLTDPELAGLEVVKTYEKECQEPTMRALRDAIAPKNAPLALFRYKGEGEMLAKSMDRYGRTTSFEMHSWSCEQPEHSDDGMEPGDLIIYPAEVKKIGEGSYGRCTVGIKAGRKMHDDFMSVQLTGLTCLTYRGIHGSAFRPR